MKRSKFAAWVAARYPSPHDVLARYFEDAQMAAASVGALLDAIPELDGAWHKLPDLDGAKNQTRSYRGEWVTDSDGTVWPSITFTAIGRGSAYWKPRDPAFQDWKASACNSVARRR